MAAATEFAKAGRVVPLAVTTLRRAPALPEVPTVAESGLPGFEVESWQGVLAPAGTPPAIVARINKDVMEALNQPAVKSQVEAQGYGIAGGSPQAFDQALAQDLKHYARIIEAAQITLQ
jgi:tripartite-type tricarboxylate transporter receptor subunit TctC